MSKIADYLRQNGVKPEALKTLSETMVENPMNALSVIQDLGISEECLTGLMNILFSDSNAIYEFAEELGIDRDQVDSVKEKMGA